MGPESQGTIALTSRTALLTQVLEGNAVNLPNLYESKQAFYPNFIEFLLRLPLTSNKQFNITSPFFGPTKLSILIITNS